MEGMIMGSQVTSIALTDIHADDEFNCRGKIAPIDVVDLAKDIQTRGLIQPVIVAPYSEEDQQEKGFKYRLIAGFRRYTAHRVNSADVIDAIIRTDIANEAEARFFNLAENIQRKDLSILQEARALIRLRDLGISETMAGEKLGMSRGWIQVRYMLLSLPEEVQEEVAAGYITQTQIRELYAIQKSEGRDAVFEAARVLKEAKIKGRKGKSVSPSKKKLSSKTHRSRIEIFEMQEHVQETLGNNLGTRCLAWAAGEISNLDLYMTIKEKADKAEIPYAIPTEGMNNGDSGTEDSGC
jgi:ParB/RepB/Spo0J family partition protein